jgi:DNA mismatch repair protein MutL
MIRVLPPEEAKKIAAGEVIDRPAALVREFIDNAVDSGASSVEVSLEGGGSRRVEVIDNGEGMDKDDLERCVLAHATSKITSLADLARSRTLGFRGEALAAAAAVSALEILSSADGREAWLLQTDGSGKTTVCRSRRTRGTTVRALGLFDAIPARKRFLKRETSESALCRQIFIEKALAFPAISFRLINEAKLKINILPASGGLKERFGELILDRTERGFLHEIHAAGGGFTVTMVFGGPELFRQDRRQQYIFANKRRVQDFALMQALEYGLGGFFPNGVHPVGAVFVEVDPALADFNIHPAKREVRFADAGAIHHTISAALRDYTRRSGLAALAAAADTALGGGTRFDFGPSGTGAAHTRGNAAALEAMLERRAEFAPLPAGRGETAESACEAEAEYGSARETPRLVGRAFDLFIIVEKGGHLYLIDQHAAHERLLYQHFLSKPVVTQELLVAIPFRTESADDDAFLRQKKDELSRLGIVVEDGEDGHWRIDALPAGWRAGDGDTVNEILALRHAGANIAEHWAAALSCKAAIKDGGYLDDEAALALAEAALALEEANGAPPRCPHGRPLWMELSRGDLFKAVRRT